MQAVKQVLDPEEHARIIQDMPAICGIAGLQPRYLRESMLNYCNAVEVDWVRNFKK